MLVILKRNLALLSLAGLIVFASCSKNNDAPEDAGKDPYGNPVTPGGTAASSGLQLATSTTFGSVFTDGNGKALYAFAIDANGTSGCVDGCLLAWPVYYAGNETAPAGVAATDIATITRADGRKQTTYKGWPLYYYSGDATKADIKGDGVGGTWFVAKPDYSVMFAKTQLIGQDKKNYTAEGVEGTGETVYLTDAAGKTLYAYTPDTFNVNTYTKADLSNNSLWPIFESEILNVPSIIKKDVIVQITAAGKKQLTYKGHPLYYFGGDAKRGETKGVSVPAPGVWPILTVNTPALTK